MLSLHRRVLALALSDRPKVRRRALECVQALHNERPYVPADFSGVTRRLCERAVSPSAGKSNNDDDNNNDDHNDSMPSDEPQSKEEVAALLQNTMRVLALIGYDEVTSSTGISLIRCLQGDDANALLQLVLNCAMSATSPLYAVRAALQCISMACAASDDAGHDGALLSADVLHATLGTLLGAEKQFASAHRTRAGSTANEGGDVAQAYNSAVAGVEQALARVDEARALGALESVVRLLAPVLRASDVRAGEAACAALQRIVLLVLGRSSSLGLLLVVVCLCCFSSLNRYQSICSKIRRSDSRLCNECANC